jgi:transposase
MMTWFLKIIFNINKKILYFLLLFCYNKKMNKNIIIQKYEEDSWLPAPEIDQLLQENSILKHENSGLKSALEQAEARVKWFEEQFKLSRQRHFGRRTETLESPQLLLNIFNAEESSLAIEAAELPSEKETITYTRKNNNKKGRCIDTSHLPRHTIIHDLKEDEKICCDCQHDLQKIGEDKSEQLEVVPQQLYVVEHIRCKYTCRHCETIKMALKELSPIPKSMAGASLLATIINSKYENHLPLYRQSKMLKSHHADIPDNTLGHWIMQSGELFLSLESAYFKELAQADYLQVDETPVKILKPYKKAYLWAYLAPHLNIVAFEFSLSRKSTIVENRLSSFAGRLQTDAYSGYNGLRSQSKIISLACFAHARRKFIEIVKLAPNKPGKASEAVALIDQLYHIETQAKEQKLSFLERFNFRQQHAKPILEQFHVWLVNTVLGTPKQSALFQAIRYTLNQWPHLIHYIEQGDVEIDNNWVENQIRPFAVGRRNWLFVGHEKSARVGALFYSLIQTCKLQSLNPYQYLYYILTKAHQLRQGVINPHELLPQKLNQQILQQHWALHQQQFLASLKTPS